MGFLIHKVGETQYMEIQRLRERGFTNSEIEETRQSTTVLKQSDGARVFIKETAQGRFNVIVEGERGIITAFRNIRRGALERLSRNYGWSE